MGPTGYFWNIFPTFRRHFWPICQNPLSTYRPSQGSGRSGAAPPRRVTMKVFNMSPGSVIFVRFRPKTSQNLSKTPKPGSRKSNILRQLFGNFHTTFLAKFSTYPFDIYAFPGLRTVRSRSASTSNHERFQHQLRFPHICQVLAKNHPRPCPNPKIRKWTIPTEASLVRRHFGGTSLIPLEPAQGARLVPISTRYVLDESHAPGVASGTRGILHHDLGHEPLLGTSLLHAPWARMT